MPFSRRLFAALPFWLSLGTLPIAVMAAAWGGLWVLALPLYTWVLFTILDALTGVNEANADPATPQSELFWHRLITWIWFPLQAMLIFGMIYHVTHGAGLGPWEKIGLFFGLGVVSGTIGINYSHELIHQRNRIEPLLGDLLLASVLYSHFRSEHLRVHHLYVGTPRDAVSARYNEGFHRYYARVILGCHKSAWRAECAMLARLGRPWHHPSNPYWRYWGLQALMLALALILGGIEGILLFALQAGVAVWQLELVNYIEHYGLTRAYLGDGRYEHVKPRHSWNAAHKASNWLLINLQRHSDHHYKPDRRFPLLQNYSAEEAPQLPLGYPAMAALAMIPPLWRRVMNPQVRAWRRKFYPEITDWTPYNKGTNPMPTRS